MLFPISPSEKKKAIQHLIDHIPIEKWEEVANAIKENGPDWLYLQHFYFGMYVRNLLREGGFNWGSMDLDCLWVELVEKAIKKKFGK
jgi:hypothetical protein